MKQTSSGIFVPDHLWKPARKFVAVVFYFHTQSNRIAVGAPDEYPIPKLLARAGWEKIVCRTAHDVDLWSQKMRDQDRRDEEMTEEQREAFEAPLRALLRQELVTKMLNARTPINREFCRAALQKIDEDEARRKIRRESYMHAEAYESNK
jgi:hypothetical protein